MNKYFKDNIYLLSAFIFLFIFIFQFLSPRSLPNHPPTITVINEIRGNQLGLENVDLLESLIGQWQVTKGEGISATWLWQYSALEDQKLVEFAKKEMKGEEFGIFLEIDKNFADKAGIKYKGSGPWYLSDGLFLVSYDQKEREKFIIKVFEIFKDKFGYYPKTVGAWWVGAESINFMQERYGITAVLQCADQYNTDKYSIWGTPWSIPYIPSSRNSAIPSNGYSEKTPNLVIMQWATRDPVRAYGKSVNESTYSIQDFTMKNYAPEKYLTYLKEIYLKKPLDQIVIGLESGFSKKSYEGAYKNNLSVIKSWESKNAIRIQQANQYAQEFLNSKNTFPPTHYFLSNGFENNDQSFWYHSPYYRIGIQKAGKEISILDLRDYSQTSLEDFFELPNTDSLLRINTKSLVDTARFENQKIILATSNNPIYLKKSEENVDLFSGEKHLARFNTDKAIFYNSSAEIRKISTSDVEKSKDLMFIDFNKKRSNLGGIVVGFLAIATYVFWYVHNNRRYSAIGIFCLFSSLLLLYPIYSSGQFPSGMIKFTQQSIYIFRLMPIFPFSPENKILFAFQIIPLFSLLAFHNLSTLFVRNKRILLGIYFSFISIYLFLVTNFQQKIIHYLSLGLKIKLLLTLLVFLIAVLLILLLKNRRKHKFLQISFLGLIIVMLFLNKNLVFEKKSFVITPFEMESLTFVNNRNQKIKYFLPPSSVAKYQSVIPLLAVNKYFPEKLTNVKWQEIQSVNHKEDLDSDTILFVPKYLSGEFLNDKKLNKIFDNGQIEVYEK